MFFGDWLQRRAALSQNKVELIDAVNNNQPITYIDWNRRTNRLANFMHAGLGIRMGDRVSFYYWNNHLATDKTVIGGWQHTGDLARKDEDGDIYIIGRVKEMIKTGRDNIYPREVEDVMHSHPSIVELALIPVHDAKWVEVGRAIVILRPDETLSEVELTTCMHEWMANY
jgi:fatty-acyl-CoA synthase